VKILLANLPWEKGGHWGVRAGSRWPHIKTAQEKAYLPFPFFLAYAASLLKKEGLEVKLIDSLALELPASDFLRVVCQEAPDLLVAETSTPSLWNDLALLKKLPADLPVALCGPESNIRDPQFLQRQNHISYVFSGEYEHTLLELVQRLEAKQSMDGVCGLIYRDGGQVKVNSPRPLLEDLDALPWPLRDGLPMHKYNDAPGEIPLPSVQMWSSRGCPYHCLFCAWPELMYQSRRYRSRSIIRVVDEMEYLVCEMGFKSVYFDDDTTNIGKLRMMELAREIKKRNLNVPWAMMARADLMDEDILENLRNAGLVAVKYGVESADQKLLDRIRKGMDIQKAARMIKLTKAIGIKSHLTFSFGLPGETQETIQKTINFALDLDPDSLQFSINTAFPGTKYYQELERQGHVVSRDFADYDGNFKAMLRTESLTDKDLLKAKRRAEKSWRDHVWQTRHCSITPQSFLKRFIGNIKKYGMAAAVSRGGAFILSKLKAINFRYDLKKLIPRNLEKIISLRHAGGRNQLAKIKKHWLNIMGVYNGSYAFKGPDCVQIDLTYNCNNNCVSCWCNSPLLGARAYKGMRKYRTLPPQLVISLLDELAGMGTSELFFSGGGEPFMHPDILRILEHAKNRGFHCCVNTNFTLVNEMVVKKLVELSVDALTVSVWAATPQVYAITHPNKDEATFYRIKDTLKMLNSMKTQARPFIKIYNVISNLNYYELEKMVEFAEEVGAEAVEFTVVDTIPGATDKLMVDQKQRAEILTQCERIQKRTNKVQVLNLEHFMRRLSDTCADLAQYDSGFLGKTPCYIGWIFSRIMPDGDVNFCLKAHRIPVGNLYKNSFREIWNSVQQKEFRQKALRFDTSDVFFQSIGNDENCKIGCYKSCDDLGRNMHMQRQIDSLSSIENLFLKFMSKIKKAGN